MILLRILSWVAIVFALAWITADWLTWKLYVEPAMDPDLVEWIISPRYGGSG